MSPFTAVRRLRRESLTPGLRGAIIAGVALHIAGVALIGATWRLPAPPADPEPYVRLTDSVTNERAEMMDPSPLFLPTPLNYGAGRARVAPVAASVPAAFRSGDPDEPPLDAPRAGMPDASASPQRPAPVYAPLTGPYAARRVDEVLPARTADLFLTAGRREADAGKLAPAGPGYVLIDETTGLTVASGALAPVAASVDSSRVLRPAEYFVSCDAYGVSTPMPRPSAGAGNVFGTGDSATDARLVAALSAALAKNPPPQGRFRVVATP